MALSHANRGTRRLKQKKEMKMEDAKEMKIEKSISIIRKNLADRADFETHDIGRDEGDIQITTIWSDDLRLSEDDVESLYDRTTDAITAAGLTCEHGELIANEDAGIVTFLTTIRIPE